MERTDIRFWKLSGTQQILYPLNKKISGWTGFATGLQVLEGTDYWQPILSPTVCFFGIDAQNRQCLPGRSLSGLRLILSLDS